MIIQLGAAPTVGFSAKTPDHLKVKWTRVFLEGVVRLYEKHLQVRDAARVAYEYGYVNDAVKLQIEAYDWLGRCWSYASSVVKSAGSNYQYFDFYSAIVTALNNHRAPVGDDPKYQSTTAKVALDRLAEYTILLHKATANAQANSNAVSAVMYFPTYCQHTNDGRPCWQNPYVAKSPKYCSSLPKDYRRPTCWQYKENLWVPEILISLFDVSKNASDKAILQGFSTIPGVTVFHQWKNIAKVIGWVMPEYEGQLKKDFEDKKTIEAAGGEAVEAHRELEKAKAETKITSATVGRFFKMRAYPRSATHKVAVEGSKSATAACKEAAVRYFQDLVPRCPNLSPPCDCSKYPQPQPTTSLPTLPDLTSMLSVFTKPSEPVSTTPTSRADTTASTPQPTSTVSPVTSLPESDLLEQEAELLAAEPELPVTERPVQTPPPQTEPSRDIGLPPPPPSKREAGLNPLLLVAAAVGIYLATR